MSNAVDVGLNSKRLDSLEDRSSATGASKKLEERIQELENERNGLLLTISDLTKNLSLESTIKTVDQLDKGKKIVMDVNNNFFGIIFRNRNKKVRLIINNDEVVGIEAI